MTVIAVGTVNGSSGATTLAYDLTARAGNGALLIEADPDGGCLAARFDVALKPGLMELAGAARTGIDADDVWRFAQTTRDGVAVVVAHPSAEQTNAALRAALGHVLTAVADVDTKRPSPPPTDPIPSWKRGACLSSSGPPLSH